MDASKNDQQIARAFADGDADVLHTVRQWIERIVRYRSWRFADPEDVAQEVVLRLMKLVRAGRFRGESKFHTFVHSVTTHACIDAYRKQKRRLAREQPEEDPDRNPGGGDPARRLDEEERFRTLAYLYQRLSDECRLLWRMVYVEHHSAARVARELGISENATRVRVHRCLERARKLAASMTSGPIAETAGGRG